MFDTNEAMRGSKTIGAYIMPYRLDQPAVAVYIDQPSLFPECLLAVQKIGGVTVPVDPDSPVSRISFIFEDVDVSAIITTRSLLGRAEEAASDGTPILLVDALRDVTGQDAVSVTLPGTSLDNDIYVIYTSGTSGYPKGVPITHRNLDPFLQWQQKEYPLDDKTALFHILSFAFDFGLKEIITTIGFGGTLVFGAADQLRNPKIVSDAIRESRATMLYVTPSFLELLIHFGPFPDVNKVCVGGEVFPRTLLRQLRKNFSPTCKIYNGYGPTEASINCAMFQVDLEGELFPEAKTIPIGTPTGEAKLYVLDESRRLCPAGVIGELFIGGPGVARGYITADEAQSSRFYSNGILGVDTEPLYQTGDLVRYLHGGALEFLGRRDSQIKFQGYRVELGEIENVLVEYAPIAAAAVIPISKNSHTDALIGYIKLNQNTKLNTAALKAFVRDRLPPYMIPSDFVVVQEMPMNQNGKLNYSALPKYEKERASTAIGSAISLAEIIAAEWSKVLGSSPVSIHDDPFLAGCSSLAAMKIHERLSHELGDAVPISWLFEYTTPISLADHILGERKTGGILKRSPIAELNSDKAVQKGRNRRLQSRARSK